GDRVTRRGGDEARRADALGGGAGEEGLTAARRADQEDVLLGRQVLRGVALRDQLAAALVPPEGGREGLLGRRLPDDGAVEVFDQLGRGEDTGRRRGGAGNDGG